MNKKTKYNPEATLDIYVKSAVLIRNDHISQLKEAELNKYNIYCVLATERPSIQNLNINNDIIEINIEQDNNNFQVGIEINDYFQTFDKDKIKHTNDEICLYLTKEDLKHNNAKNSLNVETFFEFSTGKRVTYIDEKYAAKFHISADHYWLKYSQAKKKKMNFDILYVGQSSRMAGRINSHKTIQKIQAEYMNKHRSKNIYILFLGIETQMIMSMNGFFGDTDEDVDKKHINDLVNDIQYSPFEQIVNITEALLIYYFKPPYNNKFIMNFPNAKHGSYQHYFNLDYESIIFEFYSGVADIIGYDYIDFPMIELKTNENKLSNILPNGNIKYKLHNDKNRASIFDIFENED